VERGPRGHPGALKLTVVVTGSAGHIGANLIRRLVEDGRTTRAVIRHDARALVGVPVEVAQANVLDREALRRAFDGASVVYHLAAYITITGSKADANRAHEINVLGPRNVVQCCLDAGVSRLVHVSSVHAFSQNPLNVPIDESRPLADTEPSSADYDRSKALGEREVLAGVERGLDATIVSPSGVLGPLDFKPSRMGLVLRALAARRLPAVVEGGYDWVDVRDVVDGMVAAEEQGARGERTILSGHWLSIRDLARTVGTVTGKWIPSWPCPQSIALAAAPLAQRITDTLGQPPLFTIESMRVLQGNSRFSHEKASRTLGYNPRPIADTIRDTLDWHARRPPPTT